jgi:hypothetical protein
VFTLDGVQLFDRLHPVDAKPNDITPLGDLGIAERVAKNGMVLVALRLRDRAGALLSDNTYWPGKDDASHQMLNSLPQQNLEIKAAAQTLEGERVVFVRLVNPGKTPALATKLTLVTPRGERILPALYSDNYVAVLPGEPRTIVIRYPAELGEPAAIRVRGWNVKPATVRVAASSAPQAYLLQPWQQQLYTPPPPTLKSATVVLPKR